MLTMMEAIQRRISCRSFEKRPLTPETLAQLKAYIDELNQQSGLHLQLSTVEQEKDSVKLARSMFSGGVTTYVVLTGKTDPVSAEQVGYYGQKLVLFATMLGLGTCWVAGTYDHHSIQPWLGEGEQVISVIPVGYPTEKIPLKQQMIRSTLRKGDRKDEAFVESEVLYSELPDWFRRCVEAVRMGPSAVNGQPVNLSWDKGTIRARVWKENHRLEYVDLGIAKAQFEEAARALGVDGHWEWGDRGQFLY